MLRHFRVQLALSSALIFFAAVPAVLRADLAKYQFELQAYDQEKLVKTETFHTIADTDQNAFSYASNHLAVWGQQLEKNGIKPNRLAAKLRGKTVLKPLVPPGSDRLGTIKIETVFPTSATMKFKDGEWAGTKGKSCMLLGFSANLIKEIPGVQLEYMAHIQNNGDTAWVKAGTVLKGDLEKSDFTIGPLSINHKDPERLEGLAFRLTGDNAKHYNVWYRGHVQGSGDTNWYKDGEFCGTRGKSLRLEAFIVQISHK